MRALLVALVLSLVAAAPVAAQGFAEPSVRPGETTADALDHWFLALREAESGQAAAIAEAHIEELFLRSGSPTADLLLRRAMVAMDVGEYAIALDILDGVIAEYPAFMEAWNKRATVYFIIGDFAASVADVRVTLALEPRHYGALAGLGQIYDRLGDDEAALGAYRAALNVHPFLGGLPARIEVLEARVRSEI
ncbi:MAG: hypothetical protein KIS96_11075 [Bauldia sp.]|nr:hypothetical protein [Bauldia sp.]